MPRKALAVLGTIALIASAAFAQTKAGEEKVNPMDGAVMVWVPGTAEVCPLGKFRMGSTQEEIEGLWEANKWDPAWRERTEDERPAHEVELDGFWLYKHEVTVGEYAAFLAATKHRAPPAQLWKVLGTHPDLPVVLVTWKDARAYCEWARVSLPTEAQWEYAARGPEERVYPWGNTWDPMRCNCAEHHAGKPLSTKAAAKAWVEALPGGVTLVTDLLCPVGSLRSGAAWCGALDMAGNASEWCRDCYSRGFYAGDQAAGRDPEAPDWESLPHVVRGGDCSVAPFCRGAARDQCRSGRDGWAILTGFRCVQAG